MKIIVRSVDALTTVVELDGELDLYSAADVNAALRQAIEDLQCLRLVVDVRKVRAMDFSALALFTQSGRELGARHGRLEVLCMDGGGIDALLVKASESWGGFEVRVADDE